MRSCHEVVENDFREYVDGPRGDSMVIEALRILRDEVKYAVSELDWRDAKERPLPRLLRLCLSLTQFEALTQALGEMECYNPGMPCIGKGSWSDSFNSAARRVESGRGKKLQRLQVFFKSLENMSSLAVLKIHYDQTLEQFDALASAEDRETLELTRRRLLRMLSSLRILAIYCAELSDEMSRTHTTLETFQFGWLGAPAVA